MGGAVGKKTTKAGQGSGETVAVKTGKKPDGMKSLKNQALTRGGCGFAQFSTMQADHQHLSASR
jgi:hypothetical protein